MQSEVLQSKVTAAWMSGERKAADRRGKKRVVAESEEKLFDITILFETHLSKARAQQRT